MLCGEIINLSSRCDMTSKCTVQRDETIKGVGVQ